MPVVNKKFSTCFLFLRGKYNALHIPNLRAGRPELRQLQQEPHTGGLAADNGRGQGRDGEHVRQEPERDAQRRRDQGDGGRQLWELPAGAAGRQSVGQE